MSYLLTEMVLSLLMAGVAGAAFGWLLHRVRSASRLAELRQLISDQDRRLMQSDGEIRMLSDDYEDLRQRSQTEIEVLKQENRQLPQLTQNLEKSQLLVRQLMQKHEAQLRDVGGQNASLKDQLALLSDREQHNRKLQAELDALRAQGAGIRPATVSDIDAGTRAPAAAASDAVSTPAASAVAAGTTPASGDSSLEADGDDPTFDDPIDLSEPADDTATIESSTRSSWASAKLHASDDVDPLDHVIEIDDELHAEISDETNLGEDDTLDDPPLFDPVDQHDDLKQIYGIGAVTEKSLNRLGITSYSQLAELERHDIATIAEALEIVPDRIERDDWVGSARRQLEDVLEEL